MAAARRADGATQEEARYPAGIESPLRAELFSAEQMERIAGGKITKVPFQGGAPSITALLGGHIDISFGFFGEYRGHLDAGKVKPIAPRSWRCC